MKPNIWAIGGGKGGTGKSFFTSSLGITLAKKGWRVLLIDLDVGSANLHTFLGIEPSRPSLSDFYNGVVKDMKEILVKTTVPGLDLASGAQDSLDVADMNGCKIQRLSSGMDSLDYDYILLDLGPGTHKDIVSLFLISHKGLLVITSEPTSIENAYRFLKRLFSERLKEILRNNKDRALKRLIRTGLNVFEQDGIKRPSEFFAYLDRLNPVLTDMLRQEMYATELWMIINQTDTERDSMLTEAIGKACIDYFGFKLKGILCFPYDEHVRYSIRMRRPYVELYSDTPLSRGIDSLVSTLTRGYSA